MSYIEYIRSNYTKDGILFHWQTAQHLEVIAFNLQILPFQYQFFFIVNKEDIYNYIFSFPVKGSLIKSYFFFYYTSVYLK